MALSEAKAGGKVRAEAARVVDAVTGKGRSLDAALAAAAEFSNPADGALLRNLCYGTLRQHWKLLAWLDALLERPLRSRDNLIQSLICVGLYQLTDTRVPDHAAVSMTVEAARLLRQPKFSALINAVLRNFRRKNIEAMELAGDEARYSHPAWFIDQLKLDWPDHWQAILEANNDRAPMWLRVNQRHGSTADYLQRLTAATGEQHHLLPGFDSAIRLESAKPVSGLPGFASGDVSVQDAAAQLAAQWLANGSNLRFLDACAAPGGKTGHLLELAGTESTLTAVDSDSERLQRVQENLDRLGLRATLVHADASKPKEWCKDGEFDRILLDAPCSASGVIRRHPDIKVLRRKSDIAQLASLQGRLLRALWPLLAPGGRLLYVTCSVLAEENEAVVKDFLQQTGDAREDRVLPNNNIRDLMHARTCGLQILPGTGGVDGFYFACLDKTP
jgi:16S rRNA (cytosine967-C5)-methyltransferase